MLHTSLPNLKKLFEKGEATGKMTFVAQGNALVKSVETKQEQIQTLNVKSSEISNFIMHESQEHCLRKCLLLKGGNTDTNY